MKFRLFQALFCSVGLFCIFCGCTHTSPLTRSLIKTPHQEIALEVTYREGGEEYTHPQGVDPSMIDEAFKHIGLTSSSLFSRLTQTSTRAIPAFSRDQTEFFSTHISQALLQATPLETVTFFWANLRDNGIWELTSGGVFIQDKKLHILLANYRFTMTGQKVPSDFSNFPLRQMGEYTHSFAALSPAQRLNTGVLTEIWKPQIPHFTYPLSSTLESPRTPETPSEEESSPVLSTDTVKRRLNNLLDLRREGLITQEEYKKKREKILEGL